MAKISFKKLSRGVKLLKEHIYTPVNESLSNLTDIASGGGVEVDQLKEPNGPFTIHLSIPGFDGFRNSTSIPIVLPAYQQDVVWSSGEPDITTPAFNITDIGFSFDQRDEVAGIRAATAAVDPNLLDFNEGGRYKLQVDLVETKQNSYGNTDQTNARYTNVWSAEIPSDAFITGLNPHTFSEINAQLKPLRSYFLKITAPDLPDLPTNNKTLAMPNLNVWLKLNTPLVTRDIHRPSSLYYVQNLPTVSNGEYQTTPVTAVNPPGVGDLISANYDSSTDPYDGVQTSVEKIDKLFREKLKSGYNIHSELPTSENIYNDSGYTVIAVPMWGNRSDDITEANAALLPYVGPAPYSLPSVDRRIIPIRRDFTVHHIIACANYGDTDARPKSLSFSHEVGVAIGSGLRGDLHTYQQVASLGWFPSLTSTYNIDDCIINFGSLGDSWEIVSIPLVRISGQTSDNYGVQGKPFFIGQSRTGTDTRTLVGDGSTGIAPLTKGLESFIEVRWSVSDFNGLANLNLGEVILPRYGQWVYIIGKQTLGIK